MKVLTRKGFAPVQMPWAHGCCAHTVFDCGEALPSRCFQDLDCSWSNAHFMWICGLPMFSWSICAAGTLVWHGVLVDDNFSRLSIAAWCILVVDWLRRAHISAVLYLGAFLNSSTACFPELAARRLQMFGGLSCFTVSRGGAGNFAGVQSDVTEQPVDGT